MSNKSIQVNSNIHTKLKEISDARRKAGRYDVTIAAIVSELVIKLHKKEVK